MANDDPKIIVPKAPAILKGVPTPSIDDLLKNATPEQIKALTYDNFALWAQYSGLEVDGHTFEFNNHRYLLPIYLDNSREITLIKAAQMGATVYMLLKLLHFSRYNTVKCGMYFPTADGVKCVEKGTKLVDQLRGLVCIEDVEVDDMIWSGFNWKKVTKTYHNGIEAGTNVTLKNGATLTTSNIHKIWAWKEGGIPSWHLVSELQKGDLVRYDTNVSIDKSINKEEFDIGYICGIIQGDGCTTLMNSEKYSARVSIAGSDKVVRDAFKDFCIKYTGKCAKQGSRWYDLLINSNDAIDVLEDWGITSNYSWEKKVPDICWTSNSYMAGFISGVFDTDGSIKKGHNHVEFVMTCKDMLQEMQIMLAALGIPSKFKEGTKLYKKHKHLVHKLWVSRNDFVSFFSANILCRAKKANTIICPSQINSKDTISRSHLKPLLDLFPNKDGHRKWGKGIFKPPIDHPTLHSITINKLLDWGKVCGLLTMEEISYWQEISTQKWIPVMNTTKRENVDFYDLTVEEDHSYWSNGFISHNTLSKDRLTPLIESNAELRDNILDSGDTLGLKQLRNINGKMSSIYMSYLGGQASKDSVPLDLIAFDEVRLVHPDDVAQAEQRVLHSPFKYKFFFSTAGQPNSTIDKRFKEGTQHVFTLKCGCQNGFVPSECFPECIVEHKGEVYLRCPRCKYRIYDNQNGSFIARRTDPSLPHSYSISQLISKFNTPKEIWKTYKTTQNMRDFYNSVLGRPFIDEEAKPLGIEHLENCINPDLKWAKDPTNKRKFKNTAMGVDQRGGQNHVVILARNEQNKKQIIHIEEIDSANPRYWEDGKPVTPFKRLYQLMREFDVGMCILDAMPNHNEAMAFAREFKSRVFLSYYSDSTGPDMIKWGDRVKMKEAVRRGSVDIKTKFQVTLRRYETIDYLFNVFKRREIELPDPRGLTQVMRNKETGMFENMEICQLFFKHMTSLVRETEPINKEDKDGRVKTKWIFIDQDPHLTHAINYSNIAMERLKRMPIWV